MNEPGAITTVNHEGQPIEIISTVSHQRVQHYSDVVEYIVNNEVARCRASGFNPTVEQVNFLRKEVIRYAVIRREIDTANNLKINQNRVLNEAPPNLRTRSKLLK